MHDHLGAGVGQNPCRIFSGHVEAMKGDPGGQIVSGRQIGRDDVVFSVLGEAGDQGPADHAACACNQDPAHLAASVRDMT